MVRSRVTVSLHRGTAARQGEEKRTSRQGDEDKQMKRDGGSTTETDTDTRWDAREPEERAYALHNVNS